MEDKKQLICMTTLEMLNESYNPATITVSDIAKRCGIGKGTIYEYFKSKEEILLGSIMQYIDVVQKSILGIPQSGSFRTNFNSLYYYIDSKLMVFKNIASILINSNSFKGCLGADLKNEINSKIQEIYEDIDEVLNNLITCGVKEGVIKNPKSDSDRKFTAQIMMVSFVMYRQDVSPFNDIDFDEYVRICYEKLIKMMN